MSLNEQVTEIREQIERYKESIRCSKDYIKEIRESMAFCRKEIKRLTEKRRKLIFNSKKG